MTQLQVAKNLGVDQTTVSRMESGIQSVSAAFWFSFTDLMKVSAESAKHGFVDALTDSKPRSTPYENGFFIPTKYRSARCIKVRKLLPILSFIETFSHDKKNKIYSKLQLHKAFYFNLDNQINMVFYNDLVSHLPDYQSISGNIKDLSFKKNFHGDLKPCYSKIKDIKQILRLHFSNKPKYHHLFQYQIIKAQDDKIEFSIYTLPAHVKKISKLNTRVREFLFRSELGELAQLALRGDALNKQIKIHFPTGNHSPDYLDGLYLLEILS